MRHKVLIGLGVLLLAGCAAPAPEDYVTTESSRSQQQVSLGSNTVGESCTQPEGARRSADIYCGSWQQPSGHVTSLGLAGGVSLQRLATDSPWRRGLEARFTCEAPSSGTVAGQPGLFMACVRRIGGWPYIAFVGSSGGEVWGADGVLPAFPALQRSVEVLSGRSAASITASAGAGELTAERLAARAFSSGDVGQYDALMQAGYRANLADNPVAAGKAYAAALALQEKALGRDNPAAADAMTNLALQLSNQGRFAEAAALFGRATRLASRAPDTLLPARVLHYRALDAMNQGDNTQALALLRQAETLYSDPKLVPPDTARVVNASFRNDIATSLGGNVSGLAQLDTRRALTALVDVLRYEGIVLRRLGRDKESREALARAQSVVSRSQALQAPTLMARLARSEGIAQELAGDASGSATAFSSSDLAFSQAFPGTRPAGLVAIMRGRVLMQLGRTSEALQVCRAGVRTLSELHASVESVNIGGCLDAYASAADRAPDDAGRQQILAEMFGAAQLAQSGLTSQLVMQATARLSENARDPRAADAIRRRESAEVALADAERRRELASSASTRVPPEAAAGLEKATGDARAALLEADAALQAASPRYNQLVQTSASAADVFRALRPGEGFAAIVLAGNSSWNFFLRDGTLQVAKIPGGQAAVDALVHRIRAGVEPGPAMPPFDVEAAHTLYRVVFGSLSTDVEHLRNLTIAPTGSLLSIPFEILLTEPAGGQGNLASAPWLVRKVAIAHVPSAGNFLALRQVASGSRAQRPWFGAGAFRPVTRAQAAKTFPAGCGDSAALVAGLAPLPGSRRELDTARSVVGASPSDELLGSQFTSSAVERVNLSDYKILHFAAHAVLPTDLRCLNEPAIVTSAPLGASDASGAFLTSSEVNRLHLDANLVILSACNTGGPDAANGGESLSGLARSFFFAGARNLLVTHWELSDQAATTIIPALLATIREQPSLGVAGSLRAVQLALLDRAATADLGEVSNPFFWAPFAVVGSESDGFAIAATR